MKTKLLIFLATLPALALADPLTFSNDGRLMTTSIDGTYVSTRGGTSAVDHRDSSLGMPFGFTDFATMQMYEYQGMAFMFGNGVGGGGVAAQTCAFGDGVFGASGRVSSILDVYMWGEKGAVGDSAWGSTCATSLYKVSFVLAEDTLMDICGTLAGQSSFVLLDANGFQVTGFTSDFDCTGLLLGSGLYTLVAQSTVSLSQVGQGSKTGLSTFGFTANYHGVPDEGSMVLLLLIACVFLVVARERKVSHQGQLRRIRLSKVSPLSRPAENTDPAPGRRAPDLHP